MRCLFCVVCLISGLLFSAAAQPATLNLAGDWRFALDRSDEGLKDGWFARSLSGQLQLPGVLQSQGYGDQISTNTPWVLSLYDRFWYLRADYREDTQPGQVKVPFVCQPPRHYLGVAWYQREVQVPAEWQARRIVLFLERPHWESTVWLDERQVGSCNSLVAPHIFDLGQLPPGNHRLSIRVDNRLILPYRPDAHSVSDSLGSSWNGIVGKIELRATSPVWLEDVQVFPNITNKTALLRVSLGNQTGKSGSGMLSAGGVSSPVNWTTNGTTMTLEVPLPKDAALWDEFHPALQRLNVELKGEQAADRREVVFGLREFRAEGEDFVINGHKTFLRGTHHGGDFPLTGYPPTDVNYWRKIFRTCKTWGLNHVRFHSFCPPEAAFAAADELGLYLQIEPGMWNEISPGTPMEKMLYAETERILKAYGNHPSFVLCSASNEPKGAWKRSLPAWVEHFRAQDLRHLYTTGTGWSLIDEPGPVKGADYLAVHRIGGNMLRGTTAWFGRDYARSLSGVNVPVVAHELGQWCAYPDYGIIGKFTGYMRPGNYEIFRDSLAAHGLLHKNKDFAWASGRFQLACYKEEIEANLRTPGLAGFQLLDLHDYVGQGTALVGLLDTFWESKGYATPEEFRDFCNTTVPLARLKSRVLTTADPFEVEVEVAHFGPSALANATASWSIIDTSGKTVAGSQWPACTLPIGKNSALGKVTAELSKLKAPAVYQLVVAVSQSNPPAGQPASFENRWNFWLYPAEVDASVPSDLLVTRSWSEAETRLAAGGKVLYLPRAADLAWTCPPLDTVPLFWNRLMNPAWGRMLGLWCDTNHPALAAFPTQANCDWQWTDLVRRARAINLDRLPRQLQPIVQAIDDWNRNDKLGLLFECKVGTGRLMVCTLDLENQLAQQPAARQLRRSLVAYMSSPRFQPQTTVTAEEVSSFLLDTQTLRKLGARAQAEGVDASAVVDGDPNTFWTIGGPSRRGESRKHPYELTLSFPAPVTMNGVVLMNRQNDRDHLGDIRDYLLQASDDGQTWREVMHGDLFSTWNPQTLKFPTPLTTKYLKLVARSGFGNDTSAALAEFGILYAGPKLPENSSRELEYRRVRSSSTDVDEGAPAPKKR